MANDIVVIHHAINAGEVSPRFTGRQDQNKYLAACETLQNFLPLVLGGAYVRPGSQFVAEAKVVTDHPIKRLIDFVASRTAAYVIEFGHEYCRFFFEGAPVEASVGVPFELTTPYADDDLPDLMFVQSVDVMYLFNQFYPVQKISRIAIDTFTITEVNFDPPATLEESPTGADLGAGTLTPAAITGTGINFTAASAVWLGAGAASGDVGRLIVFGGSRAVITSITSTTVAVADIIDDFPDTNPIPAVDWRLVLSPQGEIDITNDRKFKGQTMTVTSVNPSFRSGDVGKYITLYGGSAVIFAVTDASNVEVRITADLKDVTQSNPDPTRAWTLEIEAWSDALGYPSCGCFFQERLWLCKGITINGSHTGDFENFSKGADADDAIARTLSDDDIDAIVWIKAANKTLKVATGSGIFEITATAQNGALTPSSFKADPIDPNGAARVAPVRMGPILIYVQDGSREILELSYNLADDSFRSPKLFRLADHLNDGYFFTELHRAAQPDSFLFAMRNDGVLCVCIYEQVENVIGWCRVVTEGEVKSMCIIPRVDTGKDWWWVCVERENGTFIEFFEPDHELTGREWDDLHTDAAALSEPSATGLITGLDHLEGQSVWVVGDGQLFNVEQDNDTKELSSTAIVVAGEVQMDPVPVVPVAIAEVGLGYECICVPVEPVVPAEAGGPFIARYYADVGIRIRRTLGLSLRAYRVNINEPSESTWMGEQLVYRKPYMPMGQQVPLQRGKKCIISMGVDPFSRIEIKQILPFPAEIINVAGKLHTGDRWDCETYAESEVMFTPIAPGGGGTPELCTDATPRGQQVLAIEDRFDQINSNPILGANLRTGWGYISPEEEVYTLIGNQSGTGGNMAYTSTDCRINHWQTPLTFDNPAIIDPVVEPTGPLMGTSDEAVYARKLNQNLHSYYPENGDLHVDHILDQATVDNLIWQSHENLFAKIGTTFYTVAHAQALNPNFTHILGFDLLSAGSSQATDIDMGEIFTVIQLAATALHIYIFGTPDGLGNFAQIRKHLRSDGSLVDTFMLDHLGAMNIGVVNDNLIYVLCNSSGELSLRYITNFTTLNYVGHVTGLGLSAFGPTTGMFVGGAFYYGNNGFSGFSTDIYKITVSCPDVIDAPFLAEISVEAVTVVNGADIEVTWTDVLEPNATDTIWLLPAVTPPEIGIVLADLVISRLTDGLGSSSMLYEIPLGTGAGDYFLAYMSENNIFVAKTADFAVT